MELITGLSSTPQGLAVVSAIIGASAALCAQLLAGIVNLTRDLIMERIKSNRKAKLAAVYVASELEEFIRQCSNSVENWQLDVNPNDVMDVHHQTAPPSITLPHHSDLEYLDAYTVSWLFCLKSEISTIEKYSNPLGKAPPDYGRVDELRRDAYSNMMTHSKHIVSRLKKNYSLPSARI